MIQNDYELADRIITDLDVWCAACKSWVSPKAKAKKC
jgi:hypothetical protein